MLRDELDKNLCLAFPNLYRERYKTRFGLRYGFEIPEGWFFLVEELSTQLEAEILKAKPAKRPTYHALQVKEKFAHLRFYMHDMTDAMERLIDQATEKSGKTCQECGKAGTMYPPNEQRKPGSFVWLETLCPQHQDEREKSKLKTPALPAPTS
jgi:hypothetical protein